MDILVLLLFISMVLFLGAVLAFVGTVRNGTYDTTEHASLLPLARDTAAISHTAKPAEETT